MNFFNFKTKEGWLDLLTIVLFGFLVFFFSISVDDKTKSDSIPTEDLNNLVMKIEEINSSYNTIFLRDSLLIDCLVNDSLKLVQLFFKSPSDTNYKLITIGNEEFEAIRKKAFPD